MTFRWRIAQFFEIRWWRRYLHARDPKEYLDWKRAYWRNFLLKSGIEFDSGARILDAGCGPAGIFTILENHTVDALDPLLIEYERKLPHFKRADFPNIRFFCQPLETFSIDFQYDAVFCLNAINHVAELDVCLDRLAALTNPGSVLALSVDAHNYGWLKRLFRLFPGDVLHPQQFDLREYREMLRERGFEVEREVLVKRERVFGYWLLVGRK